MAVDSNRENERSDTLLNGISLVICTYNRREMLELTIPQYEKLSIPPAIQFEIIVVDNNSSDETASFLKNYFSGLNSPISYRYVFEQRQGLSHARNTGFLRAEGDYIAFADDECVLPENWLEIAYYNISKNNPAFLGGPYYGKLLPEQSSKWFKASFGDSYILQYKPRYGPLKNNYLSGGNMIVRRDVFEATGLFDPNLGMNSEKIAYGEEQDFQKRYIAMYPEAKIFYDPDLFVWHYVRAEKMSLKHLFKDAFSRGFYAAKAKSISPWEIIISPVLILLYIVRAIGSLIVKLVKSLFSKEHLFTLLHNDYKSNTWRSIGYSWYNFTQIPTIITGR